MALKWMSDGDQYYSILANPCGHILIELMSDTVHVLDTEMMIESYPRMTFRDWNSPVQTGDYITPVRVSRAISTEGLVDPFYRDILGSRQIYKVGSYFFIQINRVFAYLCIPMHYVTT